MAEQDALSKFDFDTVTKPGLFLKFKAGKPVTLRVLTTDPVVQTTEFEGDDGVNISTRFAFIVWNFTDNCAQILTASPSIARKIGELHVDPDFGANIRKIDIKISPTGEKLQRKYDIQVLPTPNDLTAAMVEEAKKIDLDKVVDGDRMSLYDPAKSQTPGHDAAKAQADKLRKEPEIEDLDEGEKPQDDVADVIEGEPVNLDDIPF